MSLVLFVAVTAYALLGIQPAMDPLLGAVRWLLAACSWLPSSPPCSSRRARTATWALHRPVGRGGAAGAAAGRFDVPEPSWLLRPDSVGPAITAMSAASSELTLMWMTIITCVGLPLVLVYHVIIYRTFRGRVKEEDLAHY